MQRDPRKQGLLAFETDRAVPGTSHEEINLCSLVDGMVKNPPANAGDLGLISGSGQSPGEGSDNLPFPLLGNPMHRGAWQATVHGVAKSQTGLSN